MVTEMWNVLSGLGVQEEDVKFEVFRDYRD